MAQAMATQPQGGENLLYVSNGQVVFVYTYWRGKMVGTLSGFAGARGLCANAAGDIFVPFIYGFSATYEFAHGGQSPIALLGFNYSYSHACSVDPKTGALAVIGGPDSGRGATYVTIYRPRDTHRWRLGKSYEVASLSRGAFCGYDASSDLFCDGTSSSGAFVLAELPANGSAFTTITVKQSIAGAGQVQWDGKHLAIGDTGVSPSIIYQFDVSGSSAKKVGSTTLAGSTTVEQFWIQNGLVIAPDVKAACGQSEAGCIFYYRYPAGGSAAKTIRLRGAYGATVSPALR